MFSKTQFQTLFAYHWHTTRHLIKIAEQLPAKDYQDNPGYGHGSIHDLLFHLMRTDNGWRLGLETGKQQAPLHPDDFPTLDALNKGLAEEELAWQAFLEKLSPEEIEGVFDLTDRRGISHSLPRWRILQHLVLHGLQHQTEIAHLLSNKGHSPGDIDFIFFG